MTNKPINDSTETKKMKLNLIFTCIATALLIIGVACLLIKPALGEYIDANGILHENFFLLPIAFASLICGFVIFLVNGIRNIAALFKKSSPSYRKNITTYLISNSVVIVICLILFLLLKMANA